ncbi:hypothetical protein PsorP6_012147 [Peronosclerospora sorghi]|uniref:Uncharacterized protein n=1 Tax=Peronosclerospora sorghi TaxID=230839 RepID=A0ACC0WK23_9STRA|nr:hypothetical protein PsorP6_012147 [Peronosclerospora sorghi]
MKHIDWQAQAFQLLWSHESSNCIMNRNTPKILHGLGSCFRRLLVLERKIIPYIGSDDAGTRSAFHQASLLCSGTV